MKGNPIPINIETLGNMIFDDMQRQNIPPDTKIELAICWAATEDNDGGSVAQQVADYLSYLNGQPVTVRASSGDVGNAALAGEALTFQEFTGNAARYEMLEEINNFNLLYNRLCY